MFKVNFIIKLHKIIGKCLFKVSFIIQRMCKNIDKLNSNDLVFIVDGYTQHLEEVIVQKPL